VADLLDRYRDSRARCSSHYVVSLVAWIGFKEPPLLAIVSIPCSTLGHRPQREHIIPSPCQIPIVAIYSHSRRLRIPAPILEHRITVRIDTYMQLRPLRLVTQTDATAHSNRFVFPYPSIENLRRRTPEEKSHKQGSLSILQVPDLSEATAPK
jgi:hypothetical protein